MAGRIHQEAVVEWDARQVGLDLPPINLQKFHGQVASSNCLLLELIKLICS